MSSEHILGGILAIALACGGSLFAQDTGRTVRHHKIAVADPSLPPEILQAETAIEKKDYATAEPLLKQVVDHNPANYRGWFDLGFVYNATGHTEDSIAAYRKCVAAKPDLFESNLNLGLMLANADQPEAEQFLRAATKLKPADHVQEGLESAWMALGHFLQATKPDEALAAFRSAATLQPNDAEPHLSAAPLLEKQNRFADAQQEYEQVLSRHPKSADALIGMANIYLRGNRFPEAETTLRQLLAMQPEYPPAHLQLARVLASDKKNDEAIAEFQTTRKLAPNDLTAQRELAELYLSAGKYDQAQGLYQSLLSGTPNDAALHRGLGQSFIKQHKFSDAQEQFLAAVSLKPDFAEAYGDLAVAANANENYELALKALQARAKFVPENPGSYFLRATALDHLRAYKEAAQNYHLFLQAAKGQYPDQEWQARHRLITIEPKK